MAVNGGQILTLNGWTDFWTRVGNFFLTPDGAGISYLTRIVFAVLFVFVSYFVIRLVGWILRKAMGLKKRGPDIDISAKYFIITVIKSALWIASAFIICSILKIDLSAIAGITSAIAVALGLALQDLIGSLFSGVLILHQKNILTGEYIKVTNAFGSCEGTVKNIHLFFTHLITPQGQVVTIPNKNMTSAVITNYSRLGKRRIDYDFGIDYHSDLAVAKEALLKVLTEDERVLKDEVIDVFVNQLDSFAIQMRMRCWTSFDDYWPVYNDLGEKIILACRNSGIQLASSTDIRVKNLEN